MGVKRPFEEEFPELSVKQHKQFDQDNKIILCEEDFPFAFTSPYNDSFGEISISIEKFFKNMAPLNLYQKRAVIFCFLCASNRICTIVAICLRISVLITPNNINLPIIFYCVPGEAKSGYYNLQHDRRLYSSHANAAPVYDKELETSAPLLWVTSSSSEEETGLEDAAFGSYFQPYFDFSIPFQFPEQSENPYFSLFSCSPRREIPVGRDRQAEVLPRGTNIVDSLHYFNSDDRTQQKSLGICTVPVPNDLTFESSLLGSVSKEVPVGLDHQAEVLPWDRNLPRKDCLGSDVRQQRLMGTCVTPMPDDSTVNRVKVGQGRTDCCCPDVGSIRCVRKHVKEARETFREAINEESFSELGFYDMGEEVACKWNADDEHLFHEIVFSNPVSRGRNFWKHLSAAFPTRTKNEIVSYYFNVFMLRRRATQNRFLLLEIDSDDDEWNGAHGEDLYVNRSHSIDSDTDDEDDYDSDKEQVGVYGEFCQVRGAHDDFTMQSFGNKDLRVIHGGSMSSESENVCANDGLFQCDGTSNGDGNVDK